jgi:hypothetical protein
MHPHSRGAFRPHYASHLALVAGRRSTGKSIDALRIALRLLVYARCDLSVRQMAHFAIRLASSVTVWPAATI